MVETHHVCSWHCSVVVLHSSSAAVHSSEGDRSPSGADGPPHSLIPNLSVPMILCHHITATSSLSSLTNLLVCIWPTTLFCSSITHWLFHFHSIFCVRKIWHFSNQSYRPGLIYLSRCRCMYAKSTGFLAVKWDFQIKKDSDVPQFPLHFSILSRSRGSFWDNRKTERAPLDDRKCGRRGMADCRRCVAVVTGQAPGPPQNVDLYHCEFHIFGAFQTVVKQIHFILTCQYIQGAQSV